MEELKQIIKDFSQARDWEQFHAPKNLAMALSTEAAEILEIFQWKEAAESLTEQELDNLRQEICDVLIYLIELADKYQIDILEAAKLKMRINEQKYPVEKVKGKADKYTKYQ
jgi:dCTP diphosphatase